MALGNNFIICNELKPDIYIGYVHLWNGTEKRLIKDPGKEYKMSLVLYYPLFCEDTY